MDLQHCYIFIKMCRELYMSRQNFDLHNLQIRSLQL